VPSRRGCPGRAGRGQGVAPMASVPPVPSLRPPGSDRVGCRCGARGTESEWFPLHKKRSHRWQLRSIAVHCGQPKTPIKLRQFAKQQVGELSL
jgi:hypothetical protein